MQFLQLLFNQQPVLSEQFNFIIELGEFIQNFVLVL